MSYGPRRLLMAGPPAAAGGLPGTPSAHWDFSDASSITETSGSISDIADQTANNYDLAQVTGGLQPQVATMAGLDSGYFNGDNIQNGHTPVGTGNLTVFIVAQVDNTSGLHSLWAEEGSGVAYNQIRVLINANRAHALISSGTVNRLSIIGPASHGTGVNIIMFGTSGTAATLKVNDATVATGTIAAGTTTPLRTILGQITGATQNLVGDLGEIVVYSSSLSSGDEDDAWTHLADKWSVTL